MFFLEKETQETRSYTLKMQLFSTQYWFKKGQSQLFGKMNLENVSILTKLWVETTQYRFLYNSTSGVVLFDPMLV